MTKTSFKVRYVIFILTVIITIVANEAILRYNLNLQDSDAKVLNIAGRQRMLSQRIVKNLLFLESGRSATVGNYSKDTLKMLLSEFENGNRFLLSKERNSIYSPKIQSLLESVQPAMLTISANAKKYVKHTDSTFVDKVTQPVAEAEIVFLNAMDAIVGEYQKIAEDKLAKTKRIALLLSLLAIVVLLGEFIFIILPFFNDLVRKNRDLEKANRKLSDFAHITSHNLRAPTSNLKSLLSFYQTSDDPSDKEDLMEKFGTVVKNLNGTMDVLVEALKTNSEPDEKQETMSFAEILEKTKLSISNQIIESDIKIESNFQEVPTIVYNRLYLESIFLNLITNAIRYRSDARAPEIVIESHQKQGKIVLSFKDNGLGIDMEKHGEKLFGLNKTFHRHPDSKGIGLFMTRSQIEGMGGVITATSTVDKGTTFSITF